MRNHKNALPVTAPPPTPPPQKLTHLIDQFERPGPFRDVIKTPQLVRQNDEAILDIFAMSH